MHKRNKQTIVSLTALALLAVPTAAMAEDITVYVDGQAQQYDVDPYLKNNRTLVPLRGVFESLGATVNWDAATDTATVTKGKRSVVLQLGNRVVTLNGQQGELDIAPELYNDSMMVPFRLVSESLGADVRWDSINSAVRVLSEERKNKTLNLMLSDEIPTMDSVLASDTNSFTVLQQTGEGLLRRDQSGRLVPGVAESWTISRDGLTYTFRLRPSAKWSDGSPVAAIDFEYAWKRALNPRTAAQWSFLLHGIENALKYNEQKAEAADVGVRAIDDRTLQVKLEKPQAHFLQMLVEPSLYPQKQSVVEAAGERFGTEASTTISNGPFKLVEWNHDRSMRLEKNAHYWDGENVALEQVNYVVNTASELANTLFNDGTIDNMPLNPGNYEGLNGAPMFGVNPRDTAYYLEFNTKGPQVLQNVKIRRALAYTVDGQALADIVYHDGKFGANGLVPNGITDQQGRDFREQGGDLMRRDLNAPKAKAMLQQGLEELGLTEFPHLKLLNSDSIVQKRVSAFLQQAWKNNLGIDVELDNIPFKFKLDRVYNKQDFDITVSAWAGDYNDPLTFLDMFTTGNGLNCNGYSRKEYDKLIADAQKAPMETEERTAMLHDAERMLLDDMQVAPLFFFRDAYMMRPYVKGWVNDGHGAQYDLKYVHIEGRN